MDKFIDWLLISILFGCTLLLFWANVIMVQFITGGFCPASGS